MYQLLFFLVCVYCLYVLHDRCELDVYKGAYITMMNSRELQQHGVIYTMVDRREELSMRIRHWPHQLSARCPAQVD